MILEILNESLFALNQLHNRISSLLTISIRLFKMLSDREMLVSFAKKNSNRSLWDNYN